jgi:hypothetical protein
VESKYNVPKKKKPETKQDQIELQIQDLIKRRDRISNPTERQALQKEIMSLYAQWERLKL